MTVLKQSCDMIDRYLLEMDNNVKQMALNQDISVLIHMALPVNGPGHYLISVAQQNLSTYKIINEQISFYYMYLQSINIILTPTTAYMDPELFYRACLNYKEISFDDWTDRILKSYHFQSFLPASQIQIEGNERSVI